MNEGSRPIVEMEGIVKNFPGVRANDQVNFSVEEGEIHALVGENGAGKTTLMKILYGIYARDEGEIFFKGDRVEIESPRQAKKLGIGMVHQHFMLVPPLSVAENITLGEEFSSYGFLRREEAVEEIARLAESVGFRIDPKEKVENLSVGSRQRVEILKVLFREAELLILDEPTAVLTPQEVEGLYQIMEKLKEEGKTIVFITHKLEEVTAIADRVTVMRSGEDVGTARVEEVDKEGLANLMVGREVLLRVEREEVERGEELLRAQGLGMKDEEGKLYLEDVSFALHGGEIFAIAGVQGNGQTELIEGLTGIRDFSEGEVVLGGERATNVDGRELRERGMGHIPEDRLGRGLVPEFTVRENLVLGYHTFPRYASRVFLKGETIDQYARAAIGEFDVRTPSISTQAESLSGGNQQKLILARELAQTPDVLIASQPTRGVDVGAIEFVHRRLMEEKASGKGILLVSTELDEILSLSDRIAVIYEGRLTGVFPAAEVSKEELGLYMAGSKKEDEEIVRERALSPSEELIN